MSMERMHLQEVEVEVEGQGVVEVVLVVGVKGLQLWEILGGLKEEGEGVREEEEGVREEEEGVRCKEMGYVLLHIH
ncbi:hypothetical protein Tco_0614177, partial [Tanacetum coccineum]